MNIRSRRAGLVVSLVPALAIFLGGCSGAHEKDRQAKEKAAEKKSAQAADAKKVHDHSGWWCEEHGIPEAECIACSAKLTAEAKKKGDWCTKHERADSQCFLCHPELKEKYAAKYRVKYNEEPPKTEDEEKAEGGKAKEEKK